MRIVKLKRESSYFMCYRCKNYGVEYRYAINGKIIHFCHQCWQYAGTAFVDGGQQLDYLIGRNGMTRG